MKQGRLAEAALERSVLGPLQRCAGALSAEYVQDGRTAQSCRNLFPAGIGEDCSALADSDGGAFVFSSEVQAGHDPMQWRLAVHRAVNNLAVGGARAVGIMLTVLLPADERDGESQLKRIMRQTVKICDSLRIAVLGGDTRVSAAVNAPVITVTGVGTVHKARVRPTCAACAGDALIVTKWVGLYGTALLAQKCGDRLGQRLPQRLIREAAGFGVYCDATKEARIAYAYGAHAAHDVTEGGVFGAMWQFAKAAGLGLSVDLKKLPIRQETVEICNELDLNPYLLVSDGCLLIAAADGRAVTEALLRAGIPAVIAGTFTEGNDRIVRNGGEVRFLEPLRQEELWKAFDCDKACESAGLEPAEQKLRKGEKGK